MACSPKQLASNRRNSLKSTGPKTTRGKEVVRKNALKHGLTGAGIAVPDEDVAAIQERFDAFDDDLRPTRATTEALVRHLAMLSVRMDCCARQQAAAHTRNILRAEQAEADVHREELQALVDDLSQNPEFSRRGLERSPRGIAWMLSEWESLKDDLYHPSHYRWNQARIERAENLIGHRYASAHRSRVGELSGAYLGDFSDLRADDWPDLPREERSQAAREELGRFIDAEIARLKAALENLDHEKLAGIESGARARALFDPSKEAVLARKYEAAAERSFFRTLKEIERLESTAPAGVEEEEDGPSQFAVDISGKLALNCSGPREAPECAEVEPGSKKRRPPAPADRRKSRPRRSRRAVEAAPERSRE